MVEKKNDFGIASLVLGISSIILSWTFIIGIAAGILGIIFGVKQKKIYQNGIATAGFITSIIGLSITVLIILFFLLMFIPMGMYMH